MNEQMMKAFAAEIEGIQKESGIATGIANFLGGGVRGLSRLGTSSGWRGLARLGRVAYKQGARGGGGVLGGLKGLAKSQVGQMAGTAGLAGLAGYGGYKLLRGDRRRQQQQY